MARYVVLEFADNADADKFIRETMGQNEIDRSARQPFSRRIVGVFVKPGKFCICGNWERSNSGDKNYKYAEVVRGEKFGWWVCTRCKKPRRGGHGLVNQLKLSETYEGTVYEEFEYGVTLLDVSGFHTNQIDRPKKLRKKKEKKNGR